MKETSVEKQYISHSSAIAFFGIIFLILMAFFTQVHPLIPYDGDDWANLSGFRAAIPKWGIWNPIKILPEVSFPVIGFIAAFLVTPLTHDYILSITWTSAVFLSLIIVAYLFLFTKILERKFSLNPCVIYTLTTAFFLFHFLALQIPGRASQYLFAAGSLTCIFHYTIPALLNLSLVEYFIAYGLPKQIPFERGIVHCSLLIFFIYLAIFSNILNSIVLIAFISSCLLWEYKFTFLSFKNLKSILKENPFLLGILAVWFLSLLFEMTGGRAQSIGASILQLPIKQTWLRLWNAIAPVGKSFPAAVALITVSSYYIVVKRCPNALKQDYISLIGRLLLSCAFLLCYLLLVCAKAAPGYIGRSDVLIDLYGFIILIVLCMTAFLLKKHPKTFVVAPIILLIIAVKVMSGSYLEPTVGRISPNICYQVDYDLISQIVQAEQNYQEEMVLRVPKGNNRSNWPHSMHMGGAIARTLYRHGIIQRPIKISIQPDVTMNVKYNIPIQK